MTYFQKRRAEILGPRKRKPRRCDLARMEAKRAEDKMRLARMTRAALRLESIFA